MEASHSRNCQTLGVPRQSRGFTRDYYLPRVYPLHLRGTGESFAANVGGRMLGSCFAALTQWLAAALPITAAHPTRVAYAAAGIALLVTLANLIASRWLPEPSSGILPEDAQDV